MPLPLDLRLALAPLDTYRELIVESADGSWRRALERPALVAVIVGTAVTLSSAERVPVGLVAMGILCWSFVPALQLLVGAIVSGMAPARSISMARSIELLFMAHLPWSLWVLVMTGLPVFTYVPLPQAAQVLSLLIPGVWTSVIVSGVLSGRPGLHDASRPMAHRSAPDDDLDALLRIRLSRIRRLGSYPCTGGPVTRIRCAAIVVFVVGIAVATLRDGVTLPPADSGWRLPGAVR